MKNLSKKDCFNVLFYLSYFLIIIADLFNDISRLSSILQIADYIAIGLLTIIIIYKLFDKKIDNIKSNIVLYLLLIIIILSSFVSKDRSLIKLGFLLLTFNEFKFSDFIKNDIILRIIAVATLLILSLVGTLNIGILEVRGGLTRYMFGESHPNVLAVYLMMISIDYFYLSYVYKRKYLFPIILSFVIMIFTFLFLGTKTCIILLILTNLLFLLNGKINIDNNKFIKKIIINSFVILFLICLFTGFFYNSNYNAWNILDRVFSRRIYYTYHFLKDYDFTLLGQELYIRKYMLLDNAYVYLFLRYGVLLLLLFVYLFRNTFIFLYNKKEKILIIILMIMLLYGVMETPLYIPAKNPFVLLLALPMLYYESRDKNEKK